MQHQDIIVQLPCPPPNGTQVLANFGFLTSEGHFFNYGSPPIAMIVFYIACFAVVCIAFMLNCKRKANFRDWKRH